MSFFYVPGNDYIIVRLVVKVYYGIAVHTPKMVMIGYVRVISPRFPVSLNEMDNADFGIGQKGAIHCIQGDIRDNFLDLLMQGLGIGMVFGFKQLLIDHDTLGCDLEVIFPAFFPKKIHGRILDI